VGLRAAAPCTERYRASSPRRIPSHAKGAMTARTGAGAIGASTSSSNSRMNSARSSGLGSPEGRVRPSWARATMVSYSRCISRGGRTSTRTRAGPLPALANRW
jgi:hypothetical protein